MLGLLKALFMKLLQPVLQLMLVVSCALSPLLAQSDSAPIRPTNVRVSTPVQQAGPVALQFSSEALVQPPGKLAADRAPRVELGAPTDEELKPIYVRGKRNVVGISRKVPSTSIEQGRWVTLDRREKSGIWQMALKSPGAKMMRVHFENVNLLNGRLWIYGLADKDQGLGPISGRGLFGDGEFWSGAVLGDTVVIEYTPGPGMTSDRIPFSIKEISHLAQEWESLRTNAAPPAIQDASFYNPAEVVDGSSSIKASIIGTGSQLGSCHIDAQCGGAYAPTGEAVAPYLLKGIDGEDYACTGFLVNTKASRGTPYFMSAAHCIDSAETARTVTAFFGYRSERCGAPAPAIPTQQIVGSTFIAAARPEDLDYALVRLSRPPDNARFLGWSTERVTASTGQVTMIHHPRGSWQRLARGVSAQADNKEFRYNYGSQNGVSESASSGSPVFTAPNVVVGVHHSVAFGGFGSACELAAQGRIQGIADQFAALYERIGPTLEDDKPCSSQVAPLYVKTVNASATTAEVSIAVSDSCDWTVAGLPSWVTASALSGKGTATLRLTLAANPGGAARTGSFTVAGHTVRLDQAGSNAACVASPLPANGEVEGTLTAQSCNSQLRPGRRAVRYSFEGRVGQRVFIEQYSTQIDGYIYLIGPNGRIMYSDDEGGSRFGDARVPAESGFVPLLADGIYIIELTTYAPDEEGTYSMRVVNGGGSSAGFFQPSSDQVTVSAPGGSNTASGKIVLTSNSRVLVNATSRTSWIRILSSTAQAPGEVEFQIDARRLLTGTYTGSILLSTNDTIPLRLSVPVSLTVTANTGPCAPRVITPPFSGTGTLAAGACGSIFYGDSFYSVQYRFRGNTGDGVRAVLTSTAFDAYLVLYDLSGIPIAEDDDSGGGRNSAIPSLTGFFRLPRNGDYIIEASSYFAFATGPFSIRVDYDAATPPTTPPTTPPVTPPPAETVPKFTAAGVVNAASFQAGSVSPGQLVTIFGSDMGPEALTFFQLVGERIPTAVAGTRVLFNGLPAPVIYSSRGQISAIVPYGIAGQTNVSVIVESAGRQSEAQTLTVGSASPALFTANQSGTGQCACLNQDNAANGPDRPANRGQVAIFYLTGEGQTDPAGQDGQLATGSVLPKPVLPVTVTIGGIEATIQYAGAAPGFTAGLMQVNAVIPEGVVPGTEVPVVIQVGNNRSRAGVTLSVR
jgi:uncharacterized protein (TIGR03437 family)